MGEVKSTFNGSVRPDMFDIKFMFFVRVPYSSTDPFGLTERDACIVENAKGLLVQSLDYKNAKYQFPEEGASSFNRFVYLSDKITRPNSNHCVYLQYWECLMHRAIVYQPDAPLRSVIEEVDVDTEIARPGD